MNKSERQLTIMMSLRYQHCNGMTEPTANAIATSYDVARVQGVSQPQAWRLVNDLVVQGLVQRTVFPSSSKQTVFYTLTDEGRKNLKERKHAFRHAQDSLVLYKTDRYRKGLMT